MFHSPDSLLRVARSDVSFPASAFGIAEKVEFIVIHFFMSCFCRCAIFILAVSVALPCFAKGSEPRGGDEWFKRDDGGGVSFVVGGSEVVHQGQMSNLAVLNGREVGGERLAELRGGGVEPRDHLSSSGKTVSPINPSKANDSNDDWDIWLAVFFAFYPLIVGGLTGCFGTAGGSRHEKPNV